MFPLIDSTYRTDSTDRAIIGFSDGGAFALYTLMNRPELFKRYLSIDGLNYGPLLPIYMRGAEEFRSKLQGRDVRLFIATAGTELYSGRIEASEVEGLTVGGLSLGRVSHVQTLPLSLGAGIIAIYED